MYNKTEVDMKKTIFLKPDIVSYNAVVKPGKSF